MFRVLALILLLVFTRSPIDAQAPPPGVTPLEPAVEQLARDVVQLLTAGDSEAAVTGISELSVRGLRDGELAGEVRELLALVADGGPYDLQRIARVPVGTALILRSSSGGAPLAFAIHMQEGPMPRITRLELPQGTQTQRRTAP